MPETKAEAALIETRQSMIRVWLAISAVWIGFWLSLATLTFLTGVDASYRAADLFALIVMLPPLVSFAAGALTRWIFEALSR